MAELPLDALFHILSRMPLNSLARFRCVCKLWCKYIDDPYLATIHEKLAMYEPMLLTRNRSCHAPNILNFSHIIESKQLPSSSSLMRLFGYIKKNICNESNIAFEVIKHPSLEYDIDRRSPRGYDRPPVDLLLGSCNGLLLLRKIQKDRCRDSSIIFLVIHPLRKQLYELPPVKLYSRWPYNVRNEESCGFGFDASTNTFKVVCVSLRKDERLPYLERNKENLCTMVHVIGTNSWREIPQVPYCPMTSEGVFVQGCLYWLVSHKIIIFDVKNEEFGLINDPPRKKGPIKWGEVFHYLVNLCGELGYVYDEISIDIKIHVWVPKKKKWVMRYRLPHKRPLPYSSINVLGCWNKDGDILLTTDESSKQLFVYNHKSGTLQKAGWIDGYVGHVQMYQGSLGSLLSIHGAHCLKY